MKRAMILLLTIFFVYGVVQSWQNNVFSTFSGKEERELTNLLYDAVSQVEKSAKYPESQDALFNAFLDEMLQALDPHSNYFSPEAYKELLEDQEGHFFGIGVLISKPSPDAPLIVINPIEGTPAYKAGLRNGDLITEVEGKPTDKMATKECVKMLKGPKGTPVTITIRRGDDEPFKVTLKRDEIPKNSVAYYFPIEKNIGYIRISYFGETTFEEVSNALKDLKREGAKSYILDLRDNPGGSLRAAVNLCSLFLKENSKIVSLKPRKGPERNFSSYGCFEFCKVPLVVLINRGSASASEIVAGALKDNQRAKIVGVRSWGKGLVQTVTPLPKGAVALTTAHYFTPSNINIQRNYASRENYFFPELTSKDCEREGGIEPDIYIDSEEISALALKIEIRRLFLEFATKKQNQQIFDDEKGDEMLLDKFKEYLKQKSIEFSDEEWEQSKSYLLHALKREYKTLTENVASGVKIMLPLDAQIRKALDVLKSENAIEKAA